MSYSQPAFMTTNPVASLVIADIESVTGADFTDAGKRALIDYRVGDICVFQSSSTAHGIDLDFGAGLHSANRCVVPAGHNIYTGSVSFQVISDTADTFPSQTNHGSTSPTDSSVIDLELTSPGTSERYWRVSLPSSSAGTWELSDLWIGTRTALSSAAAVDTGFRFGTLSQTVQTEYPGGSAAVELAAPRRTFSLMVRDVDPSSADFTLLDAVAESGRSTPFWYWPPDSSNPGPYLVQLTQDPDVQQDFVAPSVAIRYTIRFEMEEVSL